ncbi:uncharacterized protein CHSO_4373 [Chryseobacterium sp. StRB126]|uniref:hypothetical protein n=1 Tax=Chryseobacterium sp. StRB126 TaxID=878220 RepID=UPI0004E99BE7|nr:hypothetical protein [Chryseobacterium sp. StRB126]BAP33410.1 uncharacterized protein CHSO_4373 [Chryseobacterium sp. StRB126]
MTTTDIQKNIIPYIGEAVPYINIPGNSIFNDHAIETEISGHDFGNENLTHLLKILASLGSCSLYKLLNDSSKEKIYFLGEKLRIRKLSYSPLPGTLSITGGSYLESKRKGKSCLSAKDKQSGEILYSFELDYYIINQDSFKLFYKDFFNDTPIENYNEKLPEGKINTTEDYHHFNISINPFSLNQCKGHFENYPIVPFVFVANCVLREIFNFLGNRDIYEIDSLEGYASKAMPIGTEFLVEVFQQKFLKNLIYFKCEIKDRSGNSYAVMIINIKSETKK